MDSGRIWNLIGKKLSGEATPEELHDLDLMMKRGLADIYPLQILEQIWRAHPETPPQNLEQVIRKWENFEMKLQRSDQILALIEDDHQATNTSKRVKQTKTWFSALTILVVLGTAGWYYQQEQIRANQVNEIVAPMGSISKIVLPDGSRVWLNAGSKLVYKSRFGDNSRAVKLTGEAFFDVVKKDKHPFIVSTSTLSLKVLGTAFNVRSYPGDKTSEAALVRGKIEVTLVNQPDKKIMLRPTEKITVKNPLSAEQGQTTDLKQDNYRMPLITLSNTHQSTKDSLPSEALWIENTLAFDEENFEDIAHKMERWYHVNITFKNEKAKKLYFTGKFKDETIQQALTSMQSTAAFHFNINSNQIFIY